MKKRLLIFLTALFVVCAAFTVSQKKAYALDSVVSNGTLTISGTGDMTNYTSDSLPTWHSSASSITKVVIQSGVTSIGDYAFKDLKNVTSVSIPSTVTRIGKEAFWNCSSLSTLKIPSSVTTIDNYAFDSSGLTSCYLYDNVKSLGVGIFYRCTKLKSCTFTYDVANLPGLTFYGCTSLETFFIPSKIATIGESAFYDCTSLKSVTFKPALINIGKYAFSGCSSLSTMYFVCNAPTIGSNAFTGVTAKAYCIDEKYNATWTSAKKAQYGGTISWVATYAYYSSFSLSQTTYTYDGTEKKPTFTLKSGDYTHVKGTDYTVGYKDNVNVGTARACAYFAGVWGSSNSYTYKEFTISKANTTVSMNATSISRYPGNTYQLTPTPTKLNSNDTFTYSYSSSNTSAVTVSSSGLLTFKSAGTATITVTAKSANYNDTIVKVTATTKTPYTLASISLGTTSYTYDGNAKTPSVTVIDNEGDSWGTYAYSVTYSNNVNAGTATVTVTGKTDQGLTGTKSTTFTINKATQSATRNDSYASTSDIKLAPGMTYQFSWSGNMGSPSYTSSDTSIATVSSTGKVTAVKAGTVNIITKFAETSNYNARTYTDPFIIVSKTSISSIAASGTMSATSFIYDGSAKKPTITLKNGSTILVQGTDYTVSYSNNTNAGTATMTITGINLYSGTATRTFTINRADQVLNASMSSNALNVGKTATISVPGLKTTASYSSSNSNVATVSSSGIVTAKAVGTAIITVTAASNTNYNGATAQLSVTVNTTFTSISGGTLAIGTSSYTYDGTEKKPSTTVTVSGKTLTAGTDYVVTYNNNVNAGTATVTVSGQGTYNGTLSKTYTINKATQNVTGSVSQTSLKVGDTAVVSANAEGAITYSSDKTSVATVNSSGLITAVGEGTATITASAAATTNYKANTKTFSITVSKNIVSLDNCTAVLDKEDYTYDGNAKTPKVTVTEGGNKLTKDTDYTVSYSNNTNAGSATVTITGKGSYNGTITKQFNIAKADQTLTVSPESTTLEIGQTAQLTASGTGSITYASSDSAVATVTGNGLVTAKAAGIATITVTAAGNSNYNSASTIASVTVNKTQKNLTDSSITVSMAVTSFKYDGTEKRPNVTVKDGTKVLTQGYDYTLDYENQVNAGTATVIITGINDYIGSLTREYTITKVTAKVSFSVASVTKTLGNSAFITAATCNLDDADLRYASSNEAVASVDANGAVTINGMGVATISAYVEESQNTTGAQAQYTLKVNPKKVTGLKAANGTTGVDVSWTKLTGVSAYEVQRKTTSGSYSKVATVTDAKYTDKTASNGTSYVYRVRAIYTDETENTVTGSYSSTVTNCYLARASISSISNVSYRSISLKWVKNSKASGYSIQYSTSSKFSSAKTITSTGYSTVTKKITSLTKGKTYYVRIRSYKTVSGVKKYSAYSATKSVKISK